ncbi:MAG: ADP-ribosylglycohydrolase family protein [Candidatus Scalinduaceae bacterium]
MLKDKFIGCMLGTHVGDALGMPVEGCSNVAIEANYGELREMLDARMGVGTYTDDTEMMIGIAESLVECKGFDGKDMADRFVSLHNPERGYGRGTVNALSLIKRGVDWNLAGERVFEGGSYGNGSSMRIAPIGAFYYDDHNKLREVAYDSSIITHAHPLGKEGAALQAFAVANAVNMDPSEELDKHSFVLELIHFVKDKRNIYKKKLHHVEKLLDESPDMAKVIKLLGNDSSAPDSVPTAVYSFVSHCDEFEDSVAYAVSLGGDTDTIGAMTGAISGAYHGKRGIPKRWLDVLENGERGRDYIENLAEKLWEIKINIKCLFVILTSWFRE